jgi:sortase (surface protein transpeptidase)
LGINVHLLNLTNIPIEKIEKADYDDYLYSWVVKYPYTSDPGQTGNVFIFWHSSYYWWKHNPYWTIFAKLPALRHQDIIMLSWKWKIYKYRRFKRIIIRYIIGWCYKYICNWRWNITKVISKVFYQ